jgi:hypothetical protein
MIEIADDHYELDINRAHRLLGWSPRHTQETIMATTTSTGTTTDAIAINETDRLIASDKVEGTAVHNRAGEHLGSVYNFMVDKFIGCIAYAVMSFGGFLGIGERYHPLP